MNQRRESLIFLTVGAALCALTFGSQLGGSFVWDDVPTIRDNASLHSFRGLWRNLSMDAWSAAGKAPGQFYRPLLLLTFWIQVQLGAESVESFRIVNILLHLGASLAFLRLLRRFAISPGIALGAAWLFLAHPAVTEPVMFLGARQEPLGVLYTIGAVLLWPAPLTPRPHARYLLASLLVLFAFLTKEAYLVAPLLIALAHFIWHRDRLKTRAQIQQLAWLILPVGAVAVGFALRAHLGIDSQSPQARESLGSLLMAFATIIQHYGELFVTLSNAGTFALYEPLGWSMSALVLLPLCAALAWFLRLFWRSEPANITLGGAFLGLFWLAVALAPLVMFVPILGAYQNRYAYFPLLGALLAVASLAQLASPRIAVAFSKLPAARVLAYVAALGLLALTTAATRLEASLWRDDLALFETGAVREPENGIALYHYAHAVWNHAGCAKALPIYQQSVRYAPRYQRAWGNVAGCLIDLRRYREALEPARRALELAPDSPGARYNLGVVLLRLGQREQAMAELRHALALDPSHTKVRTLLDYLSTHDSPPPDDAGRSRE
ncbi:MAG TPA: tetratricopeptide repeat protein [Polyangiaceae bacterium]|nr:tetratricopeptide repeat protein [Polyangiaceae bacterium]